MDLNCVLKIEEMEEDICPRQEIKTEEEPHDIKQEDSKAEISIVVKQEEIKQEHPTQDTKEGIKQELPSVDTKEDVAMLPSEVTKGDVAMLPSEDVRTETSGDTEEDVGTPGVTGYYVWGSRPYMFEPESDPEAEQEEEPPARKPRRGVPASDWCTCGNCKEMRKESENICCQEIPQLTQRLGELANPVPGCMTDHPGFHPVCLNVYSLQRAFNTYKWHYDRLRIRSLKRRYKFLSRWSLMTWCWGLLGRQIHVDIPSCVALRIRREFPLQQGPDAPRLPPLQRRRRTTNGTTNGTTTGKSH